MAGFRLGLLRVLAGFAVILAAPGASGADRYIAEVYSQLDRIRQALARGGYVQSHSHVVDKLARDGRRAYPVMLEEGIDYAIVSVCDSDCSDVDVRVADENGNEVGIDREGDDMPVVAVTPLWPGEFTITVTLSACRAARCTIGIGFFAQPSAPDAGRDA